MWTVCGCYSTHTDIKPYLSSKSNHSFLHFLLCFVYKYDSWLQSAFIRSHYALLNNKKKRKKISHAKAKSEHDKRNTEKSKCVNDVNGERLRYTNARIEKRNVMKFDTLDSLRVTYKGLDGFLEMPTVIWWISIAMRVCVRVTISFSSYSSAIF